MAKKIGHIIRGWGKYLGLLSTSTAEAKLSELRLQICTGCEFSEHREWVDLFSEADDGMARGLVCKRCHCPCIQKSLVVDEKCPENFW